MAEDLGKIERPSVEDFRLGRKLYFVPLIFPPQEPESDLQEIINRYWEQVESHLSNLEGKLDSVRRIYHELIPLGGEDGAAGIEELNRDSYRTVKGRLDRGAELQPLEDEGILTEFMDWGRCLAAGLQNQKVFAKVLEFYVEAQKTRSIRLAERIDETLLDGETGMLLMREGHQIQFPSDIQVFYVAPPGLDEIKRWVREREQEQGRRSGDGSEASHGTQAGQPSSDS